MRKIFSKIGHFFKKRWAILVTAIVALFIGGASGFAIGHVNSNSSRFNSQQTNFTPGQGQEQGQYPGQNGQMPTPPSGFPDMQGGASTGSGNSDSSSNSDGSSSTDTSIDSANSI
ncbi:hypothetical protein [Lactovum odontotermitis]